MNTADRSISHIDSALRRRFHFYPLFPDKEPIKGLLRRYLRNSHPSLEWVAEIVDLANSRLGRDSAIGHSYFMREKLDEGCVKRIWKYSIMPLIEDHFIDRPDQVNWFELENLQNLLHGDQALEPA